MTAVLVVFDSGYPVLVFSKILGFCLVIYKLMLKHKLKTSDFTVNCST